MFNKLATPFRRVSKMIIKIYLHVDDVEATQIFNKLSFFEEQFNELKLNFYWMGLEDEEQG